ncbi:MAG: hypothetical protein R2801_01320 [Chitinophagales bacterium]
MEIRNTLLKLENYLAVVTNLNKTILSEGTMSPEELQLMKKHLYICIDKIEEVESKLGLTIDDVFDKQKASAVQLEEETIVQETVIPQEITIQIPNDLKLQQEKLPSIAIEHEPIWDLFATKIEEKELVLADVYQSNHQFENNIEEKNIVNNNVYNDDDDFLVEQNSNTLVADDEHKEELFFNNDLKDKVESTITEVENKVESVVENTHQTNNLLVAEDEEKAALFFNNDLKEKAESTITEVENKVESAVEDTHQTKSDFNLEFITDEDDNMHIAVPEFDINRKSFSENISLNEKFIFVRELFNSQFTAYEKELKKLDEMNSYQEAAQYCNTTLSDTYNWKAAQKQDNVNKFMNLLEQQFQY